jgi:metal-responsive CopG/Arc/MetJ family transcriptional regulator
VNHCIMIHHMKTIAITIDENTLEWIDRMLEQQAAPGKNRSQVIRRAVREYLINLQQEAEQAREKEIFHRNRRLLKQDALALIREQAKP